MCVCVFVSGFKTDLFEEVGDCKCSRPEAGQIARLISTGGPL